MPQPGQVASGEAAIREAMGGFLALEGRMEIEPELTVIQAGDIALVRSEDGGEKRYGGP